MHLNYYATEFFPSDIISPYFRINMALSILSSRYGSKDLFFFQIFLSALLFFMSFICLKKKTLKADEVNFWNLIIQFKD